MVILLTRWDKKRLGSDLGLRFIALMIMKAVMIMVLLMALMMIVVYGDDDGDEKKVVCGDDDEDEKEVVGMGLGFSVASSNHP